jgi:hypothetical protein
MIFLAILPPFSLKIKHEETSDVLVPLLQVPWHFSFAGLKEGGLQYDYRFILKELPLKVPLRIQDLFNIKR